MRNFKYLLITVFSLTMAYSQLTIARDFRNINRIPVAPKLSPINSASNVIPVKTNIIKRVDSAVINKAIKKIVANWNKAELTKYLAESFQGKTLLLNTIQRNIPRDAVLRLLAVQGISTIEQHWQTDKISHNRQLKSIVIATVDLQLEFNDPFNGFIRLPHTSQFYLQVLESE
jgi:hypothetical protein